MSNKRKGWREPRKWKPTLFRQGGIRNDNVMAIVVVNLEILLAGWLRKDMC